VEALGLAGFASGRVARWVATPTSFAVVGRKGRSGFHSHLL
jgi:hypothetical protein